MIDYSINYIHVVSVYPRLFNLGCFRVFAGGGCRAANSRALTPGVRDRSRHTISLDEPIITKGEHPFYKSYH